MKLNLEKAFDDYVDMVGIDVRSKRRHSELVEARAAFHNICATLLFKRGFTASLLNVDRTTTFNYERKEQGYIMTSLWYIQCLDMARVSLKKNGFSEKLMNKQSINAIKGE
jgi:hypothetical protein